MNVWRERLGRWFGPMARRVPLSPNTISLIALGLNITAAVLLAGGRRDPRCFLVAILFITTGGFADALDGIVARVQNKTSRFGDFLDHCADRLSDTLLTAAWLTGNSVREWLVIAALMGVSLNGYIGTQIEATYRQRNYDSVGRGEFVLALIVYPIVSYILATNGWIAQEHAYLTIPEWMTLLMLAFAVLGIVQRWALALRLERET
jgi:phosphatidylglycerophosphate synthase